MPNPRAADAPPSAWDEWRANWPMVVAALAGFSMSTLQLYSMGLFMGPLGAEFGWSRAEISSALTIFAILLVPLAPFAGALRDRWGSRPMALTGAVVYPAAFALLALSNGSLILWWANWTLVSFAALFITTAIWTSAISGRFVAGRGLALAVTLCGASLCQIVAPIAANALIQQFGWRGGYLGLAIGWCAVTLTLILFFFRDSAAPGRSAEAAPPVAATGLTMREALASPQIRRIAAAELVTSTLIVALLVHFVPILQSKGVDTGTAAWLASLLGFAGIVGKLVTGWLLDRSQSAWIPSACLWLPLVACLLLLDPARLGPALPLLAAVFGYSTGSYLQIVTYLTTRYAGLRNFGKIYGLMTSLMAAGTGIGPVIAGHIYDVNKDYGLWLFIGMGLSLAAGLLVFGLGPYPDWERKAGNG